jgi:hypothetical protein
LAKTAAPSIWRIFSGMASGETYFFCPVNRPKWMMAARKFQVIMFFDCCPRTRMKSFRWTDLGLPHPCSPPRPVGTAQTCAAIHVRNDMTAPIDVKPNEPATSRTSVRPKNRAAPAVSREQFG